MTMTGGGSVTDGKYSHAWQWSLPERKRNSRRGGTGSSSQTVSSITYSKRLDAMFQAVHKVNGEGIPFKLWISYKSASKPSVTAIGNDLAYLVRQYGNDPAYDHTYSSRPVLLWTGSRKYSRADVATISNRFRSSFFIVGDETQSTWADGRSAYLDGDSYYWSSQNPYTNPQSGSQVKALGDQVHAAHKLWFAPFAPGFDSSLTGHSACTPRDGTATLSRIWSMNAQSRPDAWFGISWNEFVENTYLEPSAALGTSALDALRLLIASQ